MKQAVVNITPQKAVKLLALNYAGQRPIKKAYVHQLAQQMREGKFYSMNGQTIVIGEDDNVLYDGQHRLSAIVESGCSQTLLVVYVSKGDEAFRTLDNGVKRQASDFIDARDKNACSSVAKMMACIEWGNCPLVTSLQGKTSGQVHIARGTILDYYDRRSKNINDAVEHASAMRKATGCGAKALFAVFICLVRYTHREDLLDDFVADFSASIPRNNTAFATREAIMRAGAKSRRLDAKFIIGTLLDGYEHYLAGDGSTMLNKANKRIEDYTEYVEAERAKRGKLTLETADA